MHERVFERCALPAGDFHHLHFIVGFFFFSFLKGLLLSLHLMMQDARALYCYYMNLRATSHLSHRKKKGFLEFCFDRNIV